MYTPIYPMAMIPKTNMIFKLYFLAFPKAWKEEMLKLQLRINPKFNTLYNMNTHVLYGYLNGWLEDVVQIKPIRKDSDDTNWFVSMNEPDTDNICKILQIWIGAEYIQNKKADSETQSMAERFIDMIDPDILGSGIRTEEAVLFDEKGRALTDYAFNAFALYAANALKGKTINVGGNDLTISSCGTKELISQPLPYKKSKPHYYAIGLQLSLQTTPPERRCMLLVNCSVKRFISNAWKERIYLNEDIHAYVNMGQNKYRRISLRQGYEKDIETGQKKYPHFWDPSEQRCYNLYNVKLLPNAEDVLHHPEQYIPQQSDIQILLPYKYGMDFTQNNVGTGVPIKDKKEIFTQLCSLMQDFAEPMSAAKSVGAIHCKETKEPRAHRERLRSCTEMTDLTIEIYGHDSNDQLRQEIVKKFESYFGSTENDDILPIKFVFRELGTLDNMMEDSSYKSHCKRIEDVKSQVSKSENIIGAIVILADTKNEPGDPKQALRAGFADTNRVTQFITPDGEESSDSRVHGAMTDMLRQLGYTKFNENRNTKNNPAFDADTIGVHVLSQLKPLWGNSAKDTARFLPVYITYQISSGKIMVDCDIFERRHLSYPEALLEFSKLSRDEDFTKRCADAVRSGLRTKLLGLHNLYRDKTALIMIQANGTSRQLWHGITDKKISEYSIKEDYLPAEIDIGTKSYPYMKAFDNTAVRIMRIRTNQTANEVPDYYTEEDGSGKHTQSSGIYQHEKVFWALESRPNNVEYKKSYMRSKFDDPSKNYDECGLVEFFSIQLQNGDQATQWVEYSNYLRQILPETSRHSVRLPAPLHMADLMKEYFMLDTHKK